jgi:hypothetical protein
LALIDAALKEKADQRAHELHQQQMAHAEQLHQHTLAQGAQSHESKMVQAKAKPAGRGAKASIEVKHGAEEITGPMADVVSKLADHVTQSTKTNTQAILSAVKELGRPKRIVRDKNGKPSHVEPM